MEFFEYKNVVIETPNAPESEAYRKLELNIRMAGIDKPYQVLQITSPTPQEGKTTTAINLASVYAERGKKVLIIDFDLRRPKIHRAFHKANDVGFYDFIVNETPVEDLIIKDDSNVELLLSGGRLSTPHIILQSKRVSDLIEKLRTTYDYIIIDSPPVLTVTDALLISSLVDGVVFVVAYNQTKKEQSKAALEQLKENNANVVGAVLANMDVRKTKSYYNYYYYSHEN